MRVAVINIPFRSPTIPDAWITVPPQAYGGIQWIVANLIDGLLSLGHHVDLLGAPGSPSAHPRLEVIDAAEADDIRDWLERSRVDVVHDHSNGVVALDQLRLPFISTHHFTGKPKIRRNVVYSSKAQRAQAGGGDDASVVRIPVNPERFLFHTEKRNYLLALARVSPWKGALEAAQFAAAAGVKLCLAGPSWEPEYLRQILARYGNIVKYLGDVGGEQRLQLLAEARAVLVLSQPVPGPWGDIWCEPGATVVSEAAVSGTPVISSDNGCLAEITPHVGVVLPSASNVSNAQAAQALARLPDPDTVRHVAIREWGHLKIARQYSQLYQEVIQGAVWQ